MQKSETDAYIYENLVYITVERINLNIHGTEQLALHLEKIKFNSSSYHF